MPQSVREVRTKALMTGPYGEPDITIQSRYPNIPMLPMVMASSGVGRCPAIVHTRSSGAIYVGHINQAYSKITLSINLVLPIVTATDIMARL